MEFTLVYRGSLPANGDRNAKQRIRRELHKQLRVLWTQMPLADVAGYLSENPTDGSSFILRRVGTFRIACVVTEKLNLVAEITLTMLHPEAPGGIVTQGGDIDNRLKTLFDALRMPKELSELPDGDSPSAEEDPFHCLLEDDNLITAISVRTDRLLVDPSNPSQVELLIHVRSNRTRATWDNAGF